MLSVRIATITLWFIMSAGYASPAGLDDPARVAAPGESLAEVGQTIIPFDFGGKRIPEWSGGALVLADHTNPAFPTIYAWGRDGGLLASVPFEIPDAARVRAYGWARAADGSFALVGSASTADRGTTYLAAVSADGKRQQIIRLKPFAPFAVTVGPDGTYWVAGEELLNGKEGDPQRDVIRRYSMSRGQVGGYIPRFTLKSYYFGHPAEDSFLVSSADRVGWYSNVAREYVEFSPDGKLLGRLAGLTLEGPGDTVTGVALCEGGGVFLSVQKRTTNSFEVHSLDRANGAWKLVSQLDRNSWKAARIGPVIYGCDGNDLVTRRGQELRWFRAKR